jgi:hypothetical protein
MSADAPWTPALRGLAAVEAVHAVNLGLRWGGPAAGLVLAASVWALLRPQDRRPWAGGAVVLLALALHQPLLAANHHWVLVYAATAAALVGPTRPDLRRAASGLIALVMGFATLQKLITPGFMDGRFMAFMWATGELARPLLAANPVVDLALTENAAAWEAMRRAGEPSAQVTLRWPLMSLAAWGRATAALTVLAEGALAVLAARPGRGARLPVALVLFVVPLGLLRPEWTFAATLCALGGLASPPAARWSRRLLLALVPPLLVLAAFGVGRGP